MTRTLHPLVRDGAYRKLHARLDRLQRLLKTGAPDLIIAQEARLVGLIAPMLAPQFLADLEAERDEVQAREMFGACSHPGCPGVAQHDGSEHDDLCTEHDYEAVTFKAEAEAEQSPTVEEEDDDN